MNPRGIAIFIALTSCTQPDRIIEIGQRIHHDDFEYSVTALEKTSEIKQDSITRRAKGIFYILNFTTENRAVRVDHPWDNEIAYVVGDNNEKYENNQDAQQLLDKITPFHWQTKYLTPHGETQSIRLVFDLPVTLTRPYLMVRGESLMGDVLDGHQFDHTRIKLF